MSSRVNLRLRLAYHLGNIIERQAEAFYREFAEHTTDQLIGRLCRKIAAEELAHQTLIEKHLSRFTPFPLIQMELDILDSGKAYRSLFSSPPDPKAGVKEITEYVMDQEKKMEALYTGFISDFAAASGLARLTELPELERRHVKQWQKIRDR